MTLDDFNALSPKAKEIAAVNGEFIAERGEAGFTVALYSIGCFFVELWYDRTMNEINMLAAFQSPERLEPYLWDIDLRALQQM